MESALFFLLMWILLFGSAYFSGAEAALFSLPATRVQTYQFDTDPRKRLISSLLRHPRDLLVTVFMLNTLTNILLQNSAANLFGDYAGWILKVGVPLILTLILGEIIPKYVALQHNFSISYLVAPSINFFMRILKPLIDQAVALTIPLSRLLFFYLKKEPEITHEELQHILKRSKEFGVFNSDEGELLAGYLQLKEALVKEAMRPREEILYYNIEEPLSKLIYLFTDLKCSRIPVCDPNLDRVLGIISIKQFLIHKDAMKQPQDILPYLVQPFYIPESMSAYLLLKRFKEQRQKLSLVVDEYGSVSGLITDEDLFETVIGEIADLRDQPDLYTKSGKDQIIASGKLELLEFNQIFNSNLESHSGMVTIGGWLTERLDEIPKNGTQHELEGFLFRVLAATPSRIKRLYIRKLKT